MKHTIFFLFGILFITFSCSPVCGQQHSQAEKYRKAYNYMNDSIQYFNSADYERLTADCGQLVKGKRLSFKPSLQVAKKVIEANRGFPLCNFLKKRYGMKATCVYAIGSGKHELTKHVQDSLTSFWIDYEPVSHSETLKTLELISSDKKNGFQVFFSDFYRNTLTAELMTFCLPYDEEGSRAGRATIFFFIFDENGEITEVFSGETISYN